MFPSSDKKIETSDQATPTEGVAETAEGPSDVLLSDVPESGEEQKTGASGPAASNEEQAPDDSFFSPVIELPPEIDISNVKNIAIPPNPYTIYINAFKGIQDAKVAKRELASKNLSAYIIPVDIQGNVSQSLYGATQNGRWYRVFIGSYSNKEQAREVLSEVTEKAPTFQPEILPFYYTLECGLFTSQQEAEELLTQLDENEFWPYLQIFQTQDGNNVWRILVGLFFSRRGAQTQKDQLKTEDYTCRIVKR